MMQKLMDRRVARVLAALLVLLSIWMGSGLSLNRLRAQAEAVYTEGAYGDGMGIQYDLDEIVAGGRNLTAVASRYLDEDDPLVEAVRRGCDSLEAAAGPQKQYGAAQSLRQSLEDLEARLLQESGMTSSDKDHFQKLWANISSHYRLAAQSEYNDSARQFNDVLGGFPAGFLSRLSRVEPLELYE